MLYNAVTTGTGRGALEHSPPRPESGGRPLRHISRGFTRGVPVTWQTHVGRVQAQLHEAPPPVFRFRPSTTGGLGGTFSIAPAPPYLGRGRAPIRSLRGLNRVTRRCPVSTAGRGEVPPVAWAVPPQLAPPRRCLDEDVAQLLRLGHVDGTQRPYEAPVVRSAGTRDGSGPQTRHVLVPELSLLCVAPVAADHAARPAPRSRPDQARVNPRGHPHPIDLPRSDDHVALEIASTRTAAPTSSCPRRASRCVSCQTPPRRSGTSPRAGRRSAPWPCDRGSGSCPTRCRSTGTSRCGTRCPSASARPTGR